MTDRSPKNSTTLWREAEAREHGASALSRRSAVFELTDDELAKVRGGHAPPQE
jgi:hypothetical protein